MIHRKLASRLDLLLPALVVFMLLSARPADAGSVALRELGTVTSVTVNFPIGNFRYAPSKTLDLDRLELDVQAVVGRVLEEYGIQKVDSAEQKLYILLDFVRGEENQTEYSFQVHIELLEAATLSRKWSHAKNDEPVLVTTWSDIDLGIAPRGRLHDEIVEAIEFSIERFASKARQARSIYENERQPKK